MEFDSILNILVIIVESTPKNPILYELRKFRITINDTVLLNKQQKYICAFYENHCKSPIHLLLTQNLIPQDKVFN